MRWHRRWSGQSVSMQVDLSEVNVPRVILLGQEDDGRAVIGMSWGNGNSDPVWSIEARVPIPRFIGRRLPC